MKKKPFPDWAESWAGECRKEDGENLTRAFWKALGKGARLPEGNSKSKEAK